jgi:hypothetical protein
VAPKLLLNEHVSPVIARRLTNLGFDVTCVRDRSLLGLHEKRLARGEIHFGIVPVGEWATEQTFVVLRAFLESTEDTDVLGQLIALPGP